MSLLIKNGRIITATDDYTADIFIDGETINEIGKDLLLKADKEIDAADKSKLLRDFGVKLPDPSINVFHYAEVQLSVSQAGGDNEHGHEVYDVFHNLGRHGRNGGAWV